MQYLSFIPAELNEILGKQGFRWPKHLPMAASGGEYRSLKEICDWHDVDVDKVPFPELFEVLAKGNELCKIVRIARRKVNDIWHIYTLPEKTTWVAAFSQSGAMIDLTWFESETAFWQWLYEDYQHFPLMEIPYIKSGPLSLIEWTLLSALCDQFLRMYPIPDIDWTPDQLPVFTIASLQADSRQEGGWTEAWNRLMPLTPFSEEDWEETILTWCNEGLLGKLDMPDGSDVFMIGNACLWWIRAMAWWDKGFEIHVPAKNERLCFLQATALWAIATDGKHFDVAAVDGITMKSLLKKYAGRDIQSEEKSSSRFCPECGKKVVSNDKFCRSCGAKL